MRAGFAIVLDGAGGMLAAHDLDEQPWPVVAEPAVIVLNSVDPRATVWFAENCGLATADRDAVLGPTRRTWAAAFERPDERVAALVLEAPFRTGAHMAPGAAMRVVASRRRVIVLGDLSEPAPMLDRVAADLGAGKGPRGPSELLLQVLRFWSDGYLSEALDQDKRTAALEDHSFEDDAHGDVDALRGLRRASMLLRRQLAAHRSAIAGLGALVGTDVVDANGDRWRELARESAETVDLVDGVIERLHAVDDHLQNNMSAMLGDRLYTLTLISAIILPLSFITGLLGVNVNGIPLRDSRWAFPLLCALLVGLAMFQYWIAKRLHWLPRQGRRLTVGRRAGPVRADRRA